MNAADFKNDIPLETARAAHQWSSFSPEQRGEQERDGYAGTLAADYAALAEIANTDEKKAALETEFARYRAGYRSHYLARLSADSRCASTMITGGSNFNHRRNEKANASAIKRTNELIEFRKRALAAIRKVLQPELAPIMTSDANAGDRLEAKIAAAEHRQERMKAANVAIRKNQKAGPDAQVAALVALGFAESSARELLVPDFAGRVGFPGWELTNNQANIRRMKERVVVVERARATPDATVEGSAARLEDCAAENRVRLFFPGKPDVEVRTQLKSRGFRWTPSLGCWQAYRNTGSIETARRIAGVVEQPAEVPAPAAEVAA